MKSVLTDLVKELSQISINHDHCLDESLKLYMNDDFEYRALEPIISNIIDIDRPIDKDIEIIDEDTLDIKFDDEYYTEEFNGTINSLLIEGLSEIDI